MIQFRIDSEFQNKIPPISEDEYKQLRENILAAGEVYEPLVVWDGVLVDGHNRWKIIQENPSVRYNVREMHFPDKWAAFEWMYKNQLGRRNLTDEQRAYTVGKMYEARKNTSAFKGNQYTRSGGDHNDLHQTPKSTAEAIAKEIGYAEPTVKRWGQFAEGVDALREVSPDAANKVLDGKADVSKKFIRSLKDADTDKVQAAADAIIEGRRVSVKNEEPTAPEPVEEPRPAYGVDGLIEIVQVNGKKYVDMLATSIETRKFVLDTEDAKEKIRCTITEIINDIMKVRETL